MVLIQSSASSRVVLLLIVLFCHENCAEVGANSNTAQSRPTSTGTNHVETGHNGNNNINDERAANGGDKNSFTVLSRIQLEQLVMAGKHMIVQFGSPNCRKCKEFEGEYNKLAHILIGEAIGVYRVDDAFLTRMYGIPRLPTNIYFREEGLPIMFFGGLSSYEIAEWMDSNSNQITVNLYDGDFEHLTQAATGATTGSWMVNFCKIDVPACQALSPSWEGAAARLKGRVSFAYVDPTQNEQLKKRFNIGNSLPVIMLFRQSKQYVYELPALDPASLAVFAESGYQHAKASTVSIQASPFDDIVEKVVLNLKEFASDKDNTTLYICAGAVVLMIIMGIAVLVECCRIFSGDKKEEEEAKTKKAE